MKPFQLLAIGLLSFIHLTNVFAVDATEHVDFSPGFHYSQDEKKLKSVFNDIGTSGSELCFPTSFAHLLTYLKLFNQPSSPGLLAVPSSIPVGSLEPKSGGVHDWMAIINQLTGLCNTGINSGTDDIDGQNCMKTYLKSSGYPEGCALKVGPYPPAAYQNQSFMRAVSVSDLRKYLKPIAGSAENHFGVMLLVGWYKYDPTSRQLVRGGGHFVDVYGYDYDPAWGENRIILKVVNPLSDYIGRVRENMFDDILLSSMDPTGNPVATENGPFKYELVGRGFSHHPKTPDPACTGPDEKWSIDGSNYTDNCSRNYQMPIATEPTYHGVLEEVYILSSQVSEAACEAL